MKKKHDPTLVMAQINPTVGDISSNVSRIITACLTAHHTHNPDYILFPELVLTGYPPEDLLLETDFYSQVEAGLQKIACSLRTMDCAIIIGYPTTCNGQYYNQASVLLNGNWVAHYAKQKLPNFGVFDEKRYFSPGEKTTTFSYKQTTVGLLICEDIWHDAPLSEAITQGAEVIFVLNASPYDKNKILARQKMLSNQAKKYRCLIAYANLVGGQDELIFDGNSRVVDATGATLISGPHCSEQLIFTPLITKKSLVSPATPRLTQKNSLEEIYSALLLSIQDYVAKNNFPGILIGLSGGIDSALTLALAQKALGSEKIRTVMMPSRFTSKDSILDAHTQAERLQIQHTVLSIESLFVQFLKELTDSTLPTPISPLTQENLQARIRGNILMGLSNNTGYLLLGTSNKSELAVGYSTLYGDLCAGFSPLKDVLKTEVFALAYYCNSRATLEGQPCPIPENVLSKAPSAELSYNQKDTDTLPLYPILDDILQHYIEKASPLSKLYSLHPKETVHKVLNLLRKSEYKRKQSPIGPRISTRAFGKEWRYPTQAGYFD